MNTDTSFLEPTNTEINYSKLEGIFRTPEDPDELDVCEPFIEKLVQQQEELNRFRDISNPGISYRFYHFW